MKLKSKVDLAVQKIIDKVSGSGVMQEESGAEGGASVFEGMPEAALEASRECIVMLKNDGALPIGADETVSVFGRCQIDWFYVGYGSGGDVNPPYLKGVIEGLKNDGVKLNGELLAVYENWCAENPVTHGFWGHWPMNYPEMPLDDALVKKASQVSGTALVIIGRAAGEDRENTLGKGSFYLTDTETDMLDKVTDAFAKTVVVMDCGNIIDMAWTEKYGGKISAILYPWQCGMESGSALADVISGRVSPSGKLADTIARNFEDYPSSENFGSREYNNYAEDIFVGYRYFETFAPEKVLYPFGFGLSYTQFEIKTDSFVYDSKVKIDVTVTNTGNYAGKEAVQVYVSCPDGRLKKPAKVLAAFKKTAELKPGESEKLSFCIDGYTFASFDDDTYEYVLEGGEYTVFAGSSVRDVSIAGKFSIEYTVLRKLSVICPVKEPFERIDGRKISKADYSLKKRITDNLPSETGYKKGKNYKFSQVKSGEISLDEFISSLKNEELEALTRGVGYMGSGLGVVGNAGAFCGTIPSLREKGVPPIITTDGPAGIRIKKYTSLIPCGTGLACTFNTDIITALTTVMGREMVKHGSDVLLAPGMNIHRNPLCGRNFEYFSEDPLLAGKMAAAYVNGIQSQGVSACPKHFACNNQEVNRTKNDSRVSQRALREIYLKGFEICVKEAQPLNIMTSYNKINGVWSHYNYDLVTTVLRGEWGYDGNVMTDWWMQSSASPEFPSIKDNAYRVRSQVDVLMPGGKRGAKKYKSDGTLLATLGKKDGITRAELERTARNVLTLAIKLGK